MTQVSRPLIALLAGTVVLAALYMIALKPGSSNSAGGNPGLGQYQSAINSAHNSVKLQDHQGNTAGNLPGASTSPSANATTTPSANAAAGTQTTPAAQTTPATQTTPAAQTTPRTAATHTTAKTESRSVVHDRAHTPAANRRFTTVTQALDQHRVIAMLFYNPLSPDDRAVKKELGAIPKGRGRVVKLAVPIAELSRYSVVTNQVMVSTTPTLVIIDPKGSATVITGYASGFEIQQRIDGALNVK